MQITDEMVEAAARAMWRIRQNTADIAGIHPPLADWMEENDRLRSSVRKEARAALTFAFALLPSKPGSEGG